MHSSRMPTVQCSGRLVCVCVGRGWLYTQGGSAWGVSTWGGLPGGAGSVCLEGGGLFRGVSAYGGICPGECVCFRGCVCIPACNEVDTPPPPLTEFLTHACENITFPQLLLRTVANGAFKRTIIQISERCSW